MNKKIRRIIALALTISAFSAIEPTKYFNLTTEVVQAATYGIDGLELTKGTRSSSIQMYTDEDYENETNFRRGTKEYYAETSDTSIKAEVEEKSGYESKIFKSSSSKADAYDSGDKIPISKGENTIYVRIYEEDEFDEDDVKKNVINEYKINISRADSDEDEDEDISNKIYLDNIELSDGDIDFSRKTTSYKVKVENSVSEITIIAEPEDDEDTVKINGQTVTERGKYKRKLSLDTGKNEIQVKVTDGYDKERIYTLNITRATASDEDEEEDKDNNIDKDKDNISNKDNSSNTDKDNSSNNQTNNGNNNTNTTTPGTDNNTSNTTTNKNKWIKTQDNLWTYYDENGKQLKSQWRYDTTYWKWYYFDANGYMKTEWLLDNGKWYCLGDDGAMRTGWVYAHNNWYYLNGDGTMRTGWLQEGSKKYYLNSNGAMQTTTKTIDGKTYNFDSSGVVK